MEFLRCGIRSFVAHLNFGVSVHITDCPIDILGLWCLLATEISGNLSVDHDTLSATTDKSDQGICNRRFSMIDRIFKESLFLLRFLCFLCRLLQLIKFI